MSSTNQLPKFDGQRAREIAEHQFQEGPPLRQKNIGNLVAEAIQSQLDLSKRMDEFEKYMGSEQFQTLMKIVELFEQPETLQRIWRQVGVRVDDLQHTEDPECDDARNELRKDTCTMTLLFRFIEKLQRLLSKE